MGPSTKSKATTVNVVESLRFGEPLSVTVTVMELVIAPGGPDGVQVRIPFVGLILAPAGASGPRLKDNNWAGISLSVALNFNVNNVPFNTVRLLTADRIGGVLVASERGFAGSDPKSSSSRSRYPSSSRSVPIR